MEEIIGSGVIPMNPTVQAALIGSVTSIVVCLLGFWNQNRKRHEQEIERDTKLDMRLDSIEKKLDEHNRYADKIGSIEQNLAYIRGKMEGSIK